MDNTELLENTLLCYLSLSKLQEWLKENNLWEKDFTETKKQWKQELENNLPSFFVDTELLIIEKDLILLQAEDENVQKYLAKTYQPKEQKICQKLFEEDKHFILLTKKQWQELNEKELKNSNQAQNSPETSEKNNCLVLFKDEITIKKNLTKWLEKVK